jgi:hypothetical protein
MSPPSGRPGPARYELQVEGHLDEHWSSWFGGLTLVHERDGTTTLSGVVTDQAELHGLLAKVRDLGATLISVKATDGPTGPAARVVRPPPSGEPDGSDRATADDPSRHPGGPRGDGATPPASTTGSTH